MSSASTTLPLLPVALGLLLTVDPGCSSPETRPGDSRAPDALAFPDLPAPDAVQPDRTAREAGPWISKRCIKRTVPIDGCTPSNGGKEICDGKDNDCNGLIDDVDEGKEGIYDCDKIALFGEPGPNPSSSFLAWLKASTRPENVVRVQTLLDAPALSLSQLESYNVVVLDWLDREYTEAEADLLRQFVEGGCGVVAMTGHTASEASKSRPGSLLARIGLRYAGDLENGPVTKLAPHPVTQGISKPITFLGGYRVEEVPGVSGGSNVKVAELPSGSTAGIAQQRGQGRVLVWGDEWIEYDSEWNNPSFDVPKLWANVFRWLGHYN